MAIPMKREPETMENAVSISAIENVLIKGDLSKLNEQQRTEYYLRLCNSIGLNPMTQPFQYLTLNGKLVLYARRDCADQLRKINGISIKIVSQDKAGGLLSVHVQATDRDGRVDEDLGVVPAATVYELVVGGAVLFDAVAGGVVDEGGGG